jgi:hypothetical protein
MKIRCIFAVLLIAAAAAAAAQSREDVRIYIPLVVAVDPAQADFFQKNFAMEIAAAGYTVTENVTEADYSIRLRVRENTTVYSDGTSSPVPPGEDQYILQINLVRNSDNSQVVSLSFGFSELEEMYNHNLSLVYQTLANVPLTKGDDKTLVKFMVGKDGENDDWWRNKWLYLRISADLPISFYQIKPEGLFNGGFVYEGDDVEDPDRYSRINRQTIAMPGATVGLELQFLYWMSLEANFEVRLRDTVGLAFMPGIGVQLKFPLKPSADFMVEPYAAGVYTMNLAEHSISFPRYAVGGGLQLGVKGGRSGAFFFDINYLYSLEEAVTSNPDFHYTQPEALHWSRTVIGLSLGYKTGFGNRGAKREENSTWLFNNN